MPERTKLLTGQQAGPSDERTDQAPSDGRGKGAQLGSIYANAGDGAGPRGRDLSFTARVSRRELRHAPLRIRVPLDVEGPDGDRARRAWRPPGDTVADDGKPAPADAEWVELHVPADVPTGAVLRLRGSGEVMSGGRPGDLYVTLDIADDGHPAVRPARVRAAALLGLALLAALAVVLVVLRLI